MVGIAVLVAIVLVFAVQLRDEIEDDLKNLNITGTI